jgi:hypothetical protein
MMAVRDIHAKNMAVFGIYPYNFDAECGAADLISAGFSSRDISVLFRDAPSTHAPEASSTGAPAGGLLQGALGILVGVGTLVIPDVGSMMAAGPILAGLAGDLMSALLNFGIPEYEARCYVGVVRDGGTLLSVHCNNPALAKRAKQILNSSGADHVAASGEGESRPRRIELAVI